MCAWKTDTCALTLMRPHMNFAEREGQRAFGRQTQDDSAPQCQLYAPHCFDGPLSPSFHWRSSLVPMRACIACAIVCRRLASCSVRIVLGVARVGCGCEAREMPRSTEWSRLCLRQRSRFRVRCARKGLLFPGPVCTREWFELRFQKHWTRGHTPYRNNVMSPRLLTDTSVRLRLRVRGVRLGLAATRRRRESAGSRWMDSSALRGMTRDER